MAQGLTGPCPADQGKRCALLGLFQTSDAQARSGMAVGALFGDTVPNVHTPLATRQELPRGAGADSA
jgi:hypothetical protein